MPLLNIDFDAAAAALAPGERATFRAAPVLTRLAYLVTSPDAELRAAAEAARATLARPAYISLYGVRSTLQPCGRLRTLATSPDPSPDPSLIAAMSTFDPGRPCAHRLGRWYLPPEDRWWLQVTVRDMQRVARAGGGRP